MTRISIFILGLTAALVFPATAAAHCGTTQGSFAVTCEQGVKVFRQNALSGVPAPLSQAEVNLQSVQLRAETARLSLAARQRSDARTADLRARELAIKEYQARVYDRNTRRISYPVSSYYNRGFQFGQPVRIRRGSLKVQH